MTPEDQARADYMHWFVRRHYVTKDLASLASHPLMRYYTQLIEVAEENNGMDHHDWSYPRSTPHFWVNITDLKSETPPTSTNDQTFDERLYAAWVDYQTARYFYDRRMNLRWAEAEAEFHLVTAEAVLRSYGVPVIS